MQSNTHEENKMNIYKKPDFFGNHKEHMNWLNKAVGIALEMFDLDLYEKYDDERDVLNKQIQKEAEEVRKKIKSFKNHAGCSTRTREYEHLCAHLDELRSIF